MRMRFYQTIRFKMSLMLVFVIGIPVVCLCIYGLANYQKEMEKSINDAVEQALQQTVKSTNSIIDLVISSSNAILLDEEILEILESPGFLSTQAGKTYAFDDALLLERKIAALQTTFLIDNYANITLLDFSDRFYRNWSSSQDMQIALQTSLWYERVRKSRGNLVWVAPHFAYAGMESRANSYISLARLIQTSGRTRALGVLLISIRSDDLYNRLFTNTSERTDSFTVIVNEEGVVLAAPDPTLLGEKLEDSLLNALGEKGTFLGKWRDKQSWFTYGSVRRTGWKIIQITDHVQMMQGVHALRNGVILISVCLVLCSIALATLLIARVTKRIRTIGKLMGNVEKGQFDISFQVTTHDEIAQLGRSFNHMTKRLGELIEQVKTDQERRKTLEMQALQAQINPHFLFNTLNMIRVTANMNQDMGVENMLTALGKLLELSMKKTAELIPVWQEIEAVQSYVLIQKMRYNGRVHIVYDIAPEVRCSSIPKFSLQPIIENSFIHGFDNEHRYTDIQVTATRFGTDVCIEIENNGACIPEERLGQITQFSKAESADGYNGIGLANVHERIRLRFGPQYGLTIRNKEEEGVITTVIIPFEEAKTKSALPDAGCD